MLLKSLSKYRDLGLLIIRIGLGAMFIFHGAPKLLAGPETWTKLGGAMGHLGVTFFPIAWGLMAALTETIGGALLAIGLATRPACVLLAFTMLVAALMHLDGGGLKAASHPIELGIVFLGLVFVGPGKFSIDRG